MEEYGVQCPVFTERTLQERARSLHTVLVTAVREVAQTGVSRFWPRNCGRSVGWHSGGTAVLRNLGVIVAASSAGRGMRFHDRSAGDVAFAISRMVEVFAEWTVLVYWISLDIRKSSTPVGTAFSL